MVVLKTKRRLRFRCSEAEDSEEEPGVVLGELRRARRRSYRRPSMFVLVGMLQAAAVVWFYAGAGLWLVVHGRHMNAAEVEMLRRVGPGVVGLIMAILVAGSIRSGLRGGPLVPGRPDILHLLLGPIDRALILRPLALRHLLMMAAAGAGLGGTLAAVSQDRPGVGIAEWALAGCVAGSLMTVILNGVALLFAGRRPAPAWGALVSLGLIVLNILDIVCGLHLSPTTWIGVIGLSPLEQDWLSLAAIPTAVVLAVAGLWNVAGCSLEALNQRANLVQLLHFQAAMRDVRGFLRTRALLSHEAPRSQPWLTLRYSPDGEGAIIRQRCWRSLLRWPAWRLCRVTILVLGVTGLMVLIWIGFDYLILVASVLTYMVGMEVLEPWWQEVEHPLLADMLPCSRQQLLIHHLIAAVVAAIVLGIVGILALAVLRVPVTLLGVGALGLAPVAVAAVLGAALRSGPDPTWVETMGDVIAATTPPDHAFPIAGVARVLRVAVPIGLAAIGVVPLLMARSALNQGANPFPAETVAAIASIAVVGLLMVALSRMPLFVLENA